MSAYEPFSQMILAHVAHSRIYVGKEVTGGAFFPSVYRGVIAV